MTKNRSIAAAGNRVRPAALKGGSLLLGMPSLLLLGASGVAAQLLSTPASPEAVHPPAVSTAPTATNRAGANAAPAVNNSLRTLDLYGGGCFPWWKSWAVCKR